MRLYFVRHGQTSWNAEMRWQGNQDVPLDDFGVLQAQKIAERLTNYDIDVIYSSPLSRAVQTAQIIQNKINKELFFEASLKEIMLGEWECHTTPEIKVKHELMFYEWENNPEAEIGYGIENLASLQKRAFTSIENILSRNYENVLLVAHGTWIRTLMCKFLNIPLTKRHSFEVSNCGLSIIEFDFENKIPIVLTLNDVSHLVI